MVPTVTENKPLIHTPHLEHDKLVHLGPRSVVHRMRRHNDCTAPAKQQVKDAMAPDVRPCVGNIDVALQQGVALYIT
jgi:hypothetical protein